MGNTNLKLFVIKDLFHQFDVMLPLEENINIFLGENGMGKTTILNCLYCVLSGNVEKLNSIVFDEILITFKDDSTLSLKHEDLSAYLEEGIFFVPYRQGRILFENIFSEKELQEIQDIFLDDSTKVTALKKYYYKINDLYRIPFPLFRRELEQYIIKLNHKNYGDAKKVIEFKEKMTAMIHQEILYFPTYRRIEEDMSKLGIDIEKDKVKDRLIQFGMEDVENSIQEILSTIRSAAITGFTKMTGILLKQYINGELTPDPSYLIDTDKLSIALDRIGDEIENHDKQRIIDLVSSSEIYQTENIYLLNLIKNLISSYEKQNQYDERVKKFVSVCNSYLKGKSYIYDESNVKLGIFKDHTKTPIRIQNLSSGEKQIISVFSKLYIEEIKDCIILFDEPELSLSITWQSKFLPDIIQSGKCNALIAVTHSPFIFDNTFDSLAQDMGECLVDRT